ncbi:MAG: hypothetical protein ACRCUM_04215 [Mycoplasmoidaceae bacterium]
MKGLKVIPHNTLSNGNIKDLAKALHQPVAYTDRYNFKVVDILRKEGEPIPLQKIFKKGAIKKALSSKEKSDLIILQNNFVYEIEITKKNIEFRLLDRDIEKVKKIYSKYIEKIKFSDKVQNYDLDINKNISVVEMNNKEHFMFSLKTSNKGLEPLKYILDLKRILKENEKFIYQVILQPIDSDWWESYSQAYVKFKAGNMPKKLQFKLKDIFKATGDITLNIALELLYCGEEILFGADNVQRIDTSEDSVMQIKREKGLKRATLEKGTEKGFEVAIRGICYSSSENRREFILKQFSNCFGCLDLDNSLISKSVKLNKDNTNRIKNRELFWHPLNDSKMILGVSEVQNLLQLPQITLQKELNIERLEFHEEKLTKELQQGYIPIGHVYGGKSIAYWSKIKDLLTLSKIFCGIKGSGKSKYTENYVYNAFKGGDCVIYFDYIENNENAHEVASKVPAKDVITLDLSRGFTLNYPELNLDLIEKDEDYIRNIKAIASDYSDLIARFINTINLDLADELSTNMNNILNAASTFTFIAGYNQIYNIYEILTNHNFRKKVITEVQALEFYNKNDFRYAILESLNEYDKKGKIIGTNNKADKVIARFSTLLRNSKTEEMLMGIDRNNINFAEIFEQNKLVLVLLPESYFNNYEIKDMVITYFLSRMWLAALNRAAKVKDREKRKVVHIILDEIHQLENSTSLMLKNIAEDRKFRTTYVFTCQYLKQFGKLWESVKGSGCNYMLLAGTEKDNFEMLKEEIGSKFSLEELMNLPSFHSLNIVRGREKTLTTFISELPKEL